MKKKNYQLLFKMKKNSLKLSKIDLWDELPDIVMESVKISRAQIKLGVYKNHREVMKSFKKYLSRKT